MGWAVLDWLVFEALGVLGFGVFFGVTGAGAAAAGTTTKRRRRRRRRRRRKKKEEEEEERSEQATGER